MEWLYLAMRGTTLLPSTVTKTLVCVNKFSNHEMSGVILNPFMQAPVNFISISDILTIMEKFFNKISFPRAFFQDRKFNPKAVADNEITVKDEVRQYMSEEIFTTERGEKATFVIQVQFRQNSTWQGTITWTEEKKTQKFRSTLEMIKLMDNALADENDAPSKIWG